jgi:hypothetical protein
VNSYAGENPSPVYGRNRFLPLGGGGREAVGGAGASYLGVTERRTGPSVTLSNDFPQRKRWRFACHLP